MLLDINTGSREHSEILASYFETNFLYTDIIDDNLQLLRVGK